MAVSANKLTPSPKPIFRFDMPSQRGFPRGSLIGRLRKAGLICLAREMPTRPACMLCHGRAVPKRFLRPDGEHHFTQTFDRAVG